MFLFEMLLLRHQDPDLEFLYRAPQCLYVSLGLYQFICCWWFWTLLNMNTTQIFNNQIWLKLYGTFVVLLAAQLQSTNHRSISLQDLTGFSSWHYKCNLLTKGQYPSPTTPQRFLLCRMRRDEPAGGHTPSQPPCLDFLCSGSSLQSDLWCFPFCPLLSL